jgi:hypothetical protein
MGEGASDAGPSRPQGRPVPEAAEAGGEETGAALARALDALRALAGDVAVLGGIGLERLRLGLRAGAFRIVVLSWLALVAVTATVVAVFFMVDGLAGAIAALCGGREWAGRAAGGAAVLLAMSAAALAVRVRAERRGLRRLRAKYERKPGPSPAGGTAS